MSFKVKDDRYWQKNMREGKRVRSIHLGKAGGATPLRATKLEMRAGDRINAINEKIMTLYEGGMGDKAIANTLMDEDMIEDREFVPLGPNVIRTQRHRIGVSDRVRPAPEPKTDWQAVASEQRTTIDELKSSLEHEVCERALVVGALQRCREHNYSLRFPGAL